MCYFQCLFPLHLLDDKYFVLMQLLVHWELPCLSKSFSATFIWAPERLLSCVNVGMLLQVLAESKLLKAYDTDKLFCWLMGSHVSSEWEASSEFFVTLWLFAFKWSFHSCEVLGSCKISVCYRYIFIFFIKLLFKYWLKIMLELFNRLTIF